MDFEETGNSDDTILGNPIMPTGRGRVSKSFRGGGRKPRSVVPQHSQRGQQVPICTFVQRNSVDSGKPPQSFCSRSEVYPQGARSYGSTQAHHSAQGSRVAGTSRLGFQSRFTPYHTVKRESGPEARNENIVSSPYFAAQACRNAPFQTYEMMDTQEVNYTGRNSGNDKFDCRPLTHVQAAYIRHVKEWYKHKDTVELLMDVYGFLDSEIYSKDFGRKEFVLRDATDSIYVSFYEIDTPIMHFARHTWLKVTCVWRYWGLQAVKIQVPENGFMENLDEKALNGMKVLEEKLRQYDAPKF